MTRQRETRLPELWQPITTPSVCVRVMRRVSSVSRFPRQTHSRGRIRGSLFPPGRSRSGHRIQDGDARPASGARSPSEPEAERRPPGSFFIAPASPTSPRLVAPHSRRALRGPLAWIRVRKRRFSPYFAWHSRNAPGGVKRNRPAARPGSPAEKLAPRFRPDRFPAALGPAASPLRSGRGQSEDCSPPSAPCPLVLEGK